MSQQNTIPADAVELTKHRRPKTALRVWLRMLATTNLIEKGVGRFLDKEFGTSISRFDALSALERRRDGMTMSEFSESLLITNGNATSLVRCLVEDGLASRRQSKTDKRIFTVKITSKGLRAFQRMVGPHEEILTKYFSVFSDIEIKHFLRLVEKAENYAREQTLNVHDED